MIRFLNIKDWEMIRKIHERDHANDFPFEDFSNGDFLGRIVIDNNNQIILAGGVKLITEVVLITDMTVSVRDRREALLKFLKYCTETSKRSKFDQLHCFPLTGDEWTKHLQRYGFRPTKGNALVMEIP